MADHSNEPTATDERAAAMRDGAVITSVHDTPPGGADPKTGLPVGDHDDSSPLDEGKQFDPTRGKH
jgi:hypothetical protein